MPQESQDLEKLVEQVPSSQTIREMICKHLQDVSQLRNLLKVAETRELRLEIKAKLQKKKLPKSPRKKQPISQPVGGAP